MNLKQDLILYKPWNEQEQCDKEVMQKLLEEQMADENGGEDDETTI